MPLFTKNDITLHYELYGEGSPVFLLHGAIVDFNLNYVQTGWVETLTSEGHQVICLNFRGFGESDRSPDPAFYGTANFSRDVLNLIHHLNLEKVAIVGYSMGTVIALDLLHKSPQTFSKGLLIATGDGLMGVPPHIFGKMIPGMVSIIPHETFPEHLPPHVSAYWNFYRKLGLGKESLIAFCKASYPPLTPEEVSTIKVPTMIISGGKDQVLGQGRHVADTLANGEYLEIRDADHFSLTADIEAREAAVEFLRED